jgi:hypothetical protein
MHSQKTGEVEGSMFEQLADPSGGDRLALRALCCLAQALRGSSVAVHFHASFPACRVVARSPVSSSVGSPSPFLLLLLTSRLVSQLALFISHISPHLPTDELLEQERNHRGPVAGTSSSMHWCWGPWGLGSLWAVQCQAEQAGLVWQCAAQQALN